MSDQDRISREQLMKYLKSVVTIKPEEQEIMADTFCRYDREIQEEFLRNLQIDLRIGKIK